MRSLSDDQALGVSTTPTVLPESPQSGAVVKAGTAGTSVAMRIRGSRPRRLGPALCTWPDGRQPFRSSSASITMMPLGPRT